VLYCVTLSLALIEVYVDLSIHICVLLAQPLLLLCQVQGSGVKVSIAFPPDTITPGFDAENRIKVSSE
jgi:hypothetical protein